MSGPLILRVSRQWCAVLIVLYLGALVCVLLSMAPGVVKLAVALLCLFCLIINLRYSTLQAAAAVVSLWVTEDGLWHLQNRAGKVTEVELRGDSLVSRFLVVLNFKAGNKIRNIPVIVCSDSMDACSFRRFKQYLYTRRSLA